MIQFWTGHILETFRHLASCREIRSSLSGRVNNFLTSRRERIHGAPLSPINILPRPDPHHRHHQPPLLDPVDHPPIRNLDPPLIHRPDHLPARRRAGVRSQTVDRVPQGTAQPTVAEGKNPSRPASRTQSRKMSFSGIVLTHLRKHLCRRHRVIRVTPRLGPQQLCSRQRRQKGRRTRVIAGLARAEKHPARAVLPVANHSSITCSQPAEGCVQGKRFNRLMASSLPT